MKDNGQFDRAALEQMVREVNATQVAPEDKLTDSVYHYDSKEKIFELAEKFEVRAQDRDVDKAAEKESARETDLDEKPSTLAKLKAEKEKIAKQPKKEAVDNDKHSQIFLGGSEQTTLKDLNTILGKETIDMYNTGESRGQSASYNMNYQKLGHNLMSIEQHIIAIEMQCASTVCIMRT